MSKSDDIRVRQASWSQDSVAIVGVRERVFVQEQGVPAELEIDGLDDQCCFVVAEDRDGRVTGTVRMLPDGHIGRLAVDASQRGRGIGARLLQAMIEVARAPKLAQVDLNAQEHALGFYENFGFVSEGDIFIEAGIRHRHMRLKL